MKYMALIDIGCLECGESSNVIGIFEKDSFDRKKILKKYGITNEGYWGHKNWHGQHDIHIQEIEINKINKIKD